MTVSTATRRALAIGAGILAAIAVMAGPASAASKDRNHDRIPDRWEVRHGLSLDRNQANRDQDRDKLDNRGEFKAKTNPRDDDSDGDGVEDGDEGAGTVASFTDNGDGTGTLVINDFSGGTVTGKVTADTEIECENDDAEQPDTEGDDGPDEDSDDGPGEDSHVDEDTHGDEGKSGDGEDCSTADLTPGTVVHEAELELTASGLAFEEIEL